MEDRSPALGRAICNADGFFTDGHHEVDAQHSGQGPHVVMGLVCQFTQLSHIPQHRHLTVTDGFGQHLQRRRHGLGIGVVAVVQQKPPAGKTDHPHPGAGRLIGRHAPDNLLPAQSQFLRHGHRHRGGVGHVLPGRRNGQAVDVPLCGHGAGDPLHAVVAHLCNPDLAMLRLAAAHSGERRLHRIQQGVVPIEDQQSALSQIL